MLYLFVLDLAFKISNNIHQGMLVKVDKEESVGLLAQTPIARHWQRQVAVVTGNGMLI